MLGIDFTNLRLLLVEDSQSTLNFLERYFKNKGFEVHTALDGFEALAIFEQVSPHLVITNYDMPGINGRDLIVKLRSLASEVWTSIIVLSANDDTQTIIDCRIAGADDYILKPIDLRMIEATINTHSRLCIQQEENRKNRAQLSHALEQIAQEEEMAQGLLYRLINRFHSIEDNIDYWINSADDQFSGDLITIVRRDDDNVFALIADSTGHGLAAALPTILVSHNFGELISAGKDLSKIVTQINQMLYTTLPRQYFVAATAIKVNFAHKTFEIWNGGLPNAYLLSHESNRLTKIHSEHPALGILPPSIFDARTLLFKCESDESLIVYTDGLIEAENPEGEKLGNLLLEECITDSPLDIIEQLKQLLYGFTRGEKYQDDVSVLTVKMNVEED